MRASASAARERALQIAIADAGRVEPIQISRDPGVQRLDLRLVAHARILGVEAARELDAIVDRDLRRLIETAETVEHAQGVPVRGVDGQRAQPAIQLRGDAGDHVRAGRACRVDQDRRAELQQHPAAKTPSLHVRQPARHDRDHLLRVALADAGRDARRAGLEPRQLGSVVRQPLGEDADRAAAGQHLDQRIERHLVVRGRLARIGVIRAARDRHRAQRPQHRPQEWAAEQHVLGREAHDAPARHDDQQRVDQRVGVVAREDHRAALGHVLQAHHLDLAEEHPHHQAEEHAQPRIESQAHERGPARTRACSNDTGTIASRR